MAFCLTHAAWPLDEALVLLCFDMLYRACPARVDLLLYDSYVIFERVLWTDNVLLVVHAMSPGVNSSSIRYMQDEIRDSERSVRNKRRNVAPA
jgi:hypothetical protein